MSKRMYILLNDRLTKSQRIPQGCHAVAEFMAEYGQGPGVQDWIKNHRTMVCLQTDLETMKEIVDDIQETKKYCTFVDDDYPEDFGYTAVAFEPMTREQGNKYFSKLRLA